MIKAIKNGKAAPAMAEFRNGRAWLWKYLYEDVERDPEFKANLERALVLWQTTQN